jgi:Cytochrome c554 and c-prime
MRESLKDKEHLFRVAGLFGLGVLVFFVLRGVLVPKSFGVYGHYRAGALLDNRSRSLTFAGRGACLDCHDDVREAQKASKHARIGCEACHGPLARHASDPDKQKPAHLDETALCLTCHRQNAAKPHGFPQVDAMEHAEGAPCTSCHNPHHPEQETEESKS